MNPILSIFALSVILLIVICLGFNSLQLVRHLRKAIGSANVKMKVLHGSD